MRVMNIKLIIAYDGTDYHGWQIQKNGITVQETVKNAVKKVTGEDVNVIGCGRTDAGVHSFGQTANFKTNSTLDIEKFPIAINSKIKKKI